MQVFMAKEKGAVSKAKVEIIVSPKRQRFREHFQETVGGTKTSWCWRRSNISPRGVARLQEELKEVGFSINSDYKENAEEWVPSVGESEPDGKTMSQQSQSHPGPGSRLIPGKSWSPLVPETGGYEGQTTLPKILTHYLWY